MGGGSGRLVGLQDAGEKRGVIPLVLRRGLAAAALHLRGRDGIGITSRLRRACFHWHHLMMGCGGRGAESARLTPLAWMAGVRRAERTARQATRGSGVRTCAQASVDGVQKD